MAITTTTISKPIGWARTDVIYQLEEAFTWLGWNGGTVSGIVTGLIAYDGGGTVGSSNTDYYDVFPVSTSGIGTGASFRVDRSGGSVNAVYVNRPGAGYTDGEYVTLSADDIGGSGNGATSIGITVTVAGGLTPVGYGSTNTFYDKEVTAGASYPWGVLRHTIESGKKFGDTYRVFQMGSDTHLDFHVGSSFHPWDSTRNASLGNGYANRLAGNEYLDAPIINTSSASEFKDTSRYAGSGYGQASSSYTGLDAICSSNSYGLDLNIYRSNLDPNFAVFSFKQPSLSSLKLRDNSFLTFFIHNFTSTLWEYDDLFLSGMTTIEPSTSENDPYLRFQTHCAGQMYMASSTLPSKRAAEFGYLNYSGTSTNTSGLKICTYFPRSVSDVGSSDYNGIYVRSNTNSRGIGGQSQTTDALPDSTNFNAVIKGIPLNTTLIPIPYYIPDDFVLIDFNYETPSANIQQGDTVTISGSEVYTVITGSYNQTTRTSGILFCARTT